MKTFREFINENQIIFTEDDLSGLVFKVTNLEITDERKGKTVKSVSNKHFSITSTLDYNKLIADRWKTKVRVTGKSFSAKSLVSIDEPEKMKSKIEAHQFDMHVGHEQGDSKGSWHAKFKLEYVETK
jgi:hypothetical protein